MDRMTMTYSLHSPNRKPVVSTTMTTEKLPCRDRETNGMATQTLALSRRFEEEMLGVEWKDLQIRLKVSLSEFSISMNSVESDMALET